MLTQLTPESIAVILQYILPPSQLSPLPPHLLSSSLLQRHHFLKISPDQPASYLAWPSDSDDHHTAVCLLEDYQCPIDDRLYSSFPIRYTSDPESAYAHVSISMEHSPGIRLVFQWNTPDGWKYHNLALMPFPSNSFELLQDALQSQHFPAEAGDQVDTDLSYWDAYTGSDDSQSVPPIEVADYQHGAEDHYWSQYAAIHGIHMSIELCYAYSPLLQALGTRPFLLRSTMTRNASSCRTLVFLLQLSSIPLNLPLRGSSQGDLLTFIIVRSLLPS
jgi:hypothetical protein